MSRSNGAHYAEGRGSGAGFWALLVVLGLVVAVAVGLLLLSFFDPSGFRDLEARAMARGAPGWLFR